MNRIAGIVVAVVGLLVAVLGALKVLPGLTQPGIVFVLLGLLIIGLSFVPKPASEDTPRMSTPETLAAIFYSPSEVFKNLRNHPRWLVAVLIMTVLAGVYTNLFMYRLTPERVANYAIDKTLEMSMIANNEEARKNVEAGRAQAIADSKNPVIRFGQLMSSFVGQVFWFAIIGAIFFLFILALGGKMNFWQAFSAAVYASFPVNIIRYLLSSIILFIKDPIDVHPIMGQSSLVQDSLNFLLVPGENPILYTLLSVFSILSFYWIFTNIVGLKNAGTKVTNTMAWTATVTVWLIGVAFSLLMALLFPSFIS